MNSELNSHIPCSSESCSMRFVIQQTYDETNNRRKFIEETILQINSKFIKLEEESNKINQKLNSLEESITSLKIREGKAKTFIAGVLFAISGFYAIVQLLFEHLQYKG
jgi:septal ring factor EnvC (AmiA/AmiB activator)